MDKDRVKVTIDDSVGRAKRQVGEWTGDTKTQAEGAAQQVKGKAEKARAT
ncbi:MAG: CsbD family protein [Terracidiphilus sp.]